MKTTWVRVTVFFARSACIERLRPNRKTFFALVLEFPNDLTTNLLDFISFLIFFFSTVHLSIDLFHLPTLMHNSFIH